MSGRVCGFKASRCWRNHVGVFSADERGAVTVDWVVLAAAVVGLGIGAVASVRTGAISLGDGIGTSLSGASVASLGDGAGANPSGLAAYVQRGTWGYDVVEWMAAHSSNYSDQEIIDSFNYWMSDLAQGYSPNALDAAYALVTDMQSRGIATPEHITAVNGMIAANPV